MHVLLPVAGQSVSLLLLAGVGSLVGFLSGLLGVGGGFLMTPILIMIGIPATVAAASDSCQIVAASSSGLAAHFRLGNVDVKMGLVLLAGGISGASVGVEVIKWLREIGDAALFIDLTYVVMLSLIGGLMLVRSVRSLTRRGAVARTRKAVRSRTPGWRLPWQVEFRRSGVRHSVFVPFFLCSAVGFLAAIMGVGGGFIMLPMMVYVLGMPAHVAVGTSLFQILFMSSGITIEQALVNHTVDVVLALTLALGSTIGAQFGAVVSKRLRGEQLLIILAVLALLVAGKMTVGLTSTPPSLLEPAVEVSLSRPAAPAAAALPGPAPPAA